MKIEMIALCRHRGALQPAEGSKPWQDDLVRPLVKEAAIFPACRG